MWGLSQFFGCGVRAKEMQCCLFQVEEQLAQEAIGNEPQLSGLSLGPDADYGVSEVSSFVMPSVIMQVGGVQRNVHRSSLGGGYYLAGDAHTGVGQSAGGRGGGGSRVAGSGGQSHLSSMRHISVRVVCKGGLG